MNAIVTTKEYFLRATNLPKALVSIINDYTPDFECTFRDGCKKYLKNEDLNDDLRNIVNIVVYTQLIISRKVTLNFIKSITGNGKVILVGDVSRMFYRATNFNSDISRWDVSRVTNMSRMFYGATNFNSDISRWDVSRVTNMSRMFYGAKKFNSNISNWNVSSVTNMRYMFQNAEKFNSNISKWDVSHVTNMSFMFFKAIKFNSDISRWDVSKVTNMSYMFWGVEHDFKTNISDWDLSHVTTDKNLIFFDPKYAFTPCIQQ